MATYSEITWPFDPDAAKSITCYVTKAPGKAKLYVWYDEPTKWHYTLSAGRNSERSHTGFLPNITTTDPGLAVEAAIEAVNKNNSWNIYGSNKMAFDPTDLAKTARILDDTDDVMINPELQAQVGDANDVRISTFAQFSPNPGNTQLPNPMSPLEGDEIFFAYMIPGAAFQSRDGGQWNVVDYPWQGYVQIENRWYPRIQGRVSMNDVRRSIEQWIEPIQQFVPAPPPGVDYGAQLVKIVDGPTNYGRPDELSKGESGYSSETNGGW
jgi:hypothetical protein